MASFQSIVRFQYDEDVGLTKSQLQEMITKRPKYSAQLLVQNLEQVPFSPSIHAVVVEDDGVFEDVEMEEEKEGGTNDQLELQLAKLQSEISCLEEKLATSEALLAKNRIKSQRSSDNNTTLRANNGILVESVEASELMIESLTAQFALESSNSAGEIQLLTSLLLDPSIHPSQPLQLSIGPPLTSKHQQDLFKKYNSQLRGEIARLGRELKELTSNPTPSVETWKQHLSAQKSDLDRREKNLEMSEKLSQTLKVERDLATKRLQDELASVKLDNAKMTAEVRYAKGEIFRFLKGEEKSHKELSTFFGFTQRNP